ncbi:hypothetical protein [Sphaerisporangium sp. TRM90804]|uniref:hypothetical protein n=1 Tax=Sphaerisporangium sp. TRM90804 TaxID=3031113 RepID=UPI002448D851|nr:hypothetical protein [Sphaerisporangium sp. TRM90804]MDH2424853.1 hypothetical protein [Sphaerisporangium sp. TRM90804]
MATSDRGVAYLVTFEGQQIDTAAREDVARAHAEELAEADGGPGDGQRWEWVRVGDGDSSTVALHAVAVDGFREATGYAVHKVEQAGGVA